MRGIAVLLMDGPGNGETIRFRGLPLHHETERYATPAYEFLAARGNIDPRRIGVMAISLGGYYAPRAMTKLQHFKLDGVVQRIECPFLLLHGAGGRANPAGHGAVVFRQGWKKATKQAGPPRLSVNEVASSLRSSQ